MVEAKYDGAVIATAVKHLCKPSCVYFHFKGYQDMFFINYKGLFKAKGASQPKPYFLNVGHADFASVLSPWSEHGSPDTLKQLLSKVELDHIVVQAIEPKIFKTFDEFIKWLGI